MNVTPEASGYRIRRMHVSELPRFYEHITADFIPGEYPPLEILKDHFEKGLQEGLVYSRGETDLAYATTAVGENGFVLISLLAVLNQYREKGRGSAFVKAIEELYRDKNGLIVEVEKPEFAEGPAEKEARRRRIAFYERLGFHLVPGIDYSIWDIPLHLMVLPLNAEATHIDTAIGKIIKDIYLGLMGKELMHRLIFRKT